VNFIGFAGLNIGDYSFWWKIVPGWIFLVFLNWKFLIKKVVLGEINPRVLYQCVCV
jgi:hypothetical protein